MKTVDKKFSFPKYNQSDVISCDDDSDDEGFNSKLFSNIFKTANSLSDFLKNSDNIKSLLLLRGFTKMLLCQDEFLYAFNKQKQTISKGHINLLYLRVSEYHLENIIKIHGIDLEKFYSTQFERIRLEENIVKFAKKYNNVSTFVDYVWNHDKFLTNTERLDPYQPTLLL